MSMLDFFLGVISLAPVGLFLLFWRMFPHDRGIHPIYRESGTETIGERTESLSVTALRLHMKEVGRKCKVA